jgi:class 3 adenylate cyclase
LIGSDALYAQLDPEEVHELLHSYQQCCADQVQLAGGFVAQFQGDEIVGYFGYIQASESDAERAVRAGLALVDLVPKLSRTQSVSLRVRIGIATGLVVAGDPAGEGARLEQTAVGQTLHLGARLLTQAQANQIIVSETTRRLAGRVFGYQDLGKRTLKGFPQAVQIWRVLRARPLISQFRAGRDQVLTRIVGRDVEIDLLLDTWRRVGAGQGQLITIIGEAGIGKSRLIREFRHRIAKTEHFWLEGGGTQFFRNTPFYSTTEMIRRMLDPSGRASSSELRSRLRRALGESGVAAAGALPLLAEFLDLPPEEGPSPDPLAPDQKRATLLATIVNWIRGGARLRPLVVVLEDLHWVDASSLELVGDVLSSIGSAPVMMLLSTRPRFRFPWPASPRARELRLEPLADGAIRGIVTQLETTEGFLTEEEMTKVGERSGGVPLFAIELTRLIWEQRTVAGDRQIPASLSDLLMARLDQLGPAKGVAQLAAIIGNEVPFAVLEAVSDAPRASLYSRLSVLKKHRILQEQERVSERSYAFTHALLREAAYHSIPMSRRRDLHRRTASVISDKLTAPAASRPELVAYHWTNAMESDKAAAAWQKAGDFAGARTAFKEAEQAYQNALAALMQLPASSERNSRELTLQSLLAGALRITRGFSASETRNATARARALADMNGDRAEQLRQNWGAWAAASSGGDYAAGLSLADQFYRLALADGTPENLANAYMIQMTARYRVGDLVGAEEHFLRGEEFFADPAFRRRADLVAQTYGNAALIVWTLGDDVAAQRRVDHMLATAREHDDPYGLAYAHLMAAIHAILAGRCARAAEFAANCIDFCDEYGFAQFAAAARAALGRAKTGLGMAEEGTKLISDGVAGMLAGPVRVGITMHMTWLAEAHLGARSIPQALEAAEQALRVNPQELFMRPESLRLRGEARGRLGMFAQAERDFLSAIELANRMAAKRFTQRATRGLQNLLRERAAGTALHSQ